MNILVVGCGMLGSSLCNKLSEMGHEISVIGRNAEEFSLLSPDFNGYTTVGVAIDKDVLKKAGIESCDAVAAVTPDDNMNLMIIQMVKKFFNVPRAFARVIDPTKSDVFMKMGLDAICPTNTTVETFASALTAHENPNVTIGNHTMTVSKFDIDKKMVGMRLSEIKLEENETIIAVEHENNAVSTIFLTNYELVKGDRLICAKFVD